MIPRLTLDIEKINKYWPKKEDNDWALKYYGDCALGLSQDQCKESEAFGYIPIFRCDNDAIKVGIYKESNQVLDSLLDYGYCDTEEALEKYLQTYFQDPDHYYFINFGFMPLDYEKPWKMGSYVNKDGIDTEDGYWNWIETHPADKGMQQFPGLFITYAISEINYGDD